jgi:hypothetical protein
MYYTAVIQIDLPLMQQWKSQVSSQLLFENEKGIMHTYIQVFHLHN